ncbi:hypothetical protein MCOR02_003652 [Pyricularia oryzae]|nr:hypothetical protein MCOR01_005474 [Pyricularia oryzae]KAH9434687.1 hypothetical protein MCOR02_003652 [Pyricularia oryzae]KAI6261842.1 hypothetical protein MCOR19_001926 [Pyricularia oryzae]KAI6346301.1 hypothetical protein MCOR28_003032 [Pyricularia oryzae]KAI6363000.1 hypothetical protein MCOR31_008007 [Pyricularia oryzae]
MTRLRPLADCDASIAWFWKRGGKAVRAVHSLCNAGGLAGWFFNNNRVQVPLRQPEQRQQGRVRGGRGLTLNADFSVFAFPTRLMSAARRRKCRG